MLCSSYACERLGLGAWIVAEIGTEVVDGLFDCRECELMSAELQVAGLEGGSETVNMKFNPAEFVQEDVFLPVLTRPCFLPIVSSDALALILLKKANGPIDGFIVEGNLAGGHKSPLAGFAVEFAGHREYVAGDDPRHVDWRLYYKRDRLFIKQYEMETNFPGSVTLSKRSMEMKPSWASTSGFNRAAASR